MRIKANAPQRNGPTHEAELNASTDTHKKKEPTSRRREQSDASVSGGTSHSSSFLSGSPFFFFFFPFSFFTSFNQLKFEVLCFTASVAGPVPVPQLQATEGVAARDYFSDLQHPWAAGTGGAGRIFACIARDSGQRRRRQMRRWRQRRTHHDERVCGSCVGVRGSLEVPHNVDQGAPQQPRDARQEVGPHAGFFYMQILPLCLPCPETGDVGCS